MEVTENRNWHPDCEKHGYESVWYRDVGKALFDTQDRRLRDLQLLARKRREGQMLTPEDIEMARQYMEVGQLLKPTVIPDGDPDDDMPS